MKNLKLNLTIFSITFLFCYFILVFYSYYNFDDQFQNKFKTLENYKIHKKYSQLINHIKDEENLKTYFKETNSNDLFFTVLNDNIKNSNITVLLQGDSWIEQINEKEHNLFSYKLFQEFGLKFNIKFINGGIPSYSPSLMKIQLNLLKNDFNINPEIIIAFIDQVNFGDELCRYKKNKIFKNGELIKVKPENFLEGVGWYNYSEKYKLTEIYYSKKNNFFKTIELVNYKFFSRLKKISFNVYIKIQNIMNHEKIIVQKCYWDEIQKYLINPSPEDLKYFRNTIIDYIETATKLKNTKKIIIVTFPRKEHLMTNSKLTFNVSNMINDIIISDKKFKSIQHLDFNKIINNNRSLFNNDNAWLNDGNHLNSDYHGSFFVNGILKEIKKTINN